MCYINGVKVSLETYIRYKQQEKELKQLRAALLYQPAKKGFDYSEWPIIKPSADGKDWDVVAMEWGFIPSYLKNREEVKRFRNGYVDSTGKFRTGITALNFIGEEVLDKPMYKDSALKRRCLVLSSGFYEHRHIQVVGKSGKLLKTPEKFPYHITVKDRPLFYIPGIWNNWTDKNTGESVDTFALGTTEANSLMKQVHNSKGRMPIILPPDLADEWTEPDLSPERIKEILSYQIPASEMEAHTVRKDFLEQEDPDVEFKYEAVPELEV
jgi:putative SOS response-associated peptidase YedK